MVDVQSAAVGAHEVRADVVPATVAPGSVALLPVPATCVLGAVTPLHGPMRLLLSGEVPASLTRRLIARWRRAAGWPLLLRGPDGGGVDTDSADLVQFAGSVTIVLDASAARPPGVACDEWYQLRVAGADARLTAAHGDGLQRGVETLLQLLTTAGIVECVIDDSPRFSYRGVMLDAARHFLPLADVLRVLDGMAALKLNVLHLHLSDDQGFRLESRVLPRLSGSGSDGEFYTQEEIVYLVRQATERGIRVIPELDMPGHCQSWLVGYPQLAPLPKAWQLRRQFGIGRGGLDPTREETYAFINELLGEVAMLFPDRYVHIGGDEVHPKAWMGVPHIEAFMRERGMTHQRELQGYFTARVARILAQHGRQVVAWDEVLGAALPAGTVVQAWRSGEARDNALRAGADVIVSSGYYFDLSYPAHAHYDFDPEAGAAQLHRWEDSLAHRPGFEAVAKPIGVMLGNFRGDATHTPAGDASPGRVIGGEACLWSELVTPELLDLRLFSRLTAVAERLWSPAAVCDHGDFYARHERVLARLAGQLGLRLDSAPAMARVDRDLAAAVDTIAADRRQVLLDAVEPVKWYARLLGAELLASRARGETDAPLRRPYDTTTPLQRVVDRIAPESLVARRVAADCVRWRTTRDAGARAALLAVAQAWQQQAQQWDELGAPDACGGLTPLARRLGELGAALAAVLHDRAPQLDRALQAPCEDLFLVVERDVLRLIENVAQ